MKIKIRIYPAYANEKEIIVFGHLFKKQFDKLSLNASMLKNARAIVRMFMPKPIANTAVSFKFRQLEIKSKTLKDGYFHFSVPYSEPIACGWHTFQISTEQDGLSFSEKGSFVKPYPGEYGLISDIDDTFLVSHSNNIFKKLYVMLSRNVEKRKVFKGVVKHYRKLNYAGRKDKKWGNVFFYVSSSEWNLFQLIDEFTDLHDFPKAVFQLQKLKIGLFDLLFSGKGDHEHKFHKIKHIMEFYPDLKFVLLGDDSQQDPYIFEKVAKTFPENLFATYIRQTKKQPKRKVQEVLNLLQEMNIHSCYFKDSEVAIKHSTEIGLIA